MRCTSCTPSPAPPNAEYLPKSRAVERRQVPTGTSSSTTYCQHLGHHSKGTLTTSPPAITRISQHRRACSDWHGQREVELRRLCDGAGVIAAQCLLIIQALQSLRQFEQEAATSKGSSVGTNAGARTYDVIFGRQERVSPWV
jgi:hypothetical protein